MEAYPGSRDQIRTALAGVLRSEEFHRSRRMQRFLSFIVEESLAGRASGLKEYVVGVQVFDQQPSFDPVTNPLVRVEARRLRSKLQRYYRTEGERDQLVIEVPRGSYAPRFRPRPNARSIVLLPFTAAGAAAAPLASALTWQVADLLVRVHGVQILARYIESVPCEPSAKEDSSGSILTGMVRSEGATLHAIIQWVDRRNGAYLWSASIRGAHADSSSELAGAIASAFAQHLVERSTAAARPVMAPVNACFPHELDEILELVRA